MSSEMGGSITEADKIRSFESFTDTERAAAMGCGLVGYLGGIILTIQTGTSESLLMVGETFGTAGAAALAGVGIVTGARRYMHYRWLKGSKRLYTEDINSVVSDDFDPGFENLSVWLKRQDKRKD